MDWYLASVLIFAVILAVLIYRDRSKFTRDSIFLLRRTKVGRDLLIRIGTTFPGFWKVVGFVSVATGFVVSVFGTKMLIDNVVASIAAGTAAPSLALLLPSPTAEPVFGYGYLAVPFWYWIICIALLALVHEGFHGIFTAREKTKIKSLGFGILAIIPLAFVEPDEKQLAKKGVWPQLRVFSAGSFANFLLAIVSIILFICIINSIYVPGGVDFQTYPFAQIAVSSINSIGNSSVSGTDDIVSVLEEYGDNETVELATQNGTFYIKKGYLVQNLESSTDGNVLVFQDYPAARSGIEGTIVRIDDYGIGDTADLSLALEKAGVGHDIDVVVRNGESTETYNMETVNPPGLTQYTADESIYVFVALEHFIPGSIDFQQAFGEWWGSLVGQRTEVTWNYIQYKIALWEWVSENYPELSATAESNIQKWNLMLDDHNEPGFIGILNVTPHLELADGLKPYSGATDFIQGLLLFLFMINLGVGIVNLLPVKPLDGGKMWDVVLNRYVPKHAKKIMRALGYFILALLIANFLPLGALF